MVCSLILLYFDRPQINIEINCLKLYTINPEICSTFFLDKRLGIDSPAHFAYDFLTKMFLVLYSIINKNLKILRLKRAFKVK